MFRTCIFTALLFCSTLLSHAAEVWAPGVSQSGGWVDYNKSVINNGPMADTAMCWAASSSNIIKWWMNNNPGAATQPGDPWLVSAPCMGMSA